MRLLGTGRSRGALASGPATGARARGGAPGAPGPAPAELTGKGRGLVGAGVHSGSSS